MTQVQNESANCGLNIKTVNSKKDFVKNIKTVEAIQNMIRRMKT